MHNSRWLAITIGNTHGRIGEFFDRELTQVHRLTHAEIIDFLTNPQKYLSADFAGFSHWLAKPSPDMPTSALSQDPNPKPIRLATVVPELALPWQDLPYVQCLTLADVPLKSMYPTLGIDRALAAWGAGQRYGFPVLVIDAGTALTFTAVDPDQNLLGGAILPGLNTQLRSLHGATAALPHTALPQTLPPLWARDTITAMHSGVIYTVIASVWAFTQQWRQQFPHSAIVFTGGDGAQLSQWFRQWLEQRDLVPATAANYANLYHDPHLVLQGMALASW
ncbi:MAG: pantothenate kinase [Pseudanabaena sp. ELA607]